MANDPTGEPALVTALRDLMADLSDLLRKEARLAKAELTEAVASKAKAGIWMAVAGVLAFVAVLLLIEAAVFALASLGLGLHWSALIVAAVLAVVATGAFLYGRSLAQEPAAPSRTLDQINNDIAAVREQLS